MEEYVSVSYKELKGNLSLYSAVILFRKKNGKKRAMICTRDETTIKLFSGTSKEGILCGYDKRHTEETKTLGVIDLAILDARTIPTDRILGLVYVGRLDNDTNIDLAFQYYNNVSRSLEELEKAESAAQQQEVQQMYNS